jgi:hypothetical protein
MNLNDIPVVKLMQMNSRNARNASNASQVVKQDAAVLTDTHTATVMPAMMWEVNTVRENEHTPAILNLSIPPEIPSTPMPSASASKNEMQVSAQPVSVFPLASLSLNVLPPETTPKVAMPRVEKPKTEKQKAKMLLTENSNTMTPFVANPLHTQSVAHPENEIKTYSILYQELLTKMDKGYSSGKVLTGNMLRDFPEYFFGNLC